MKTKTASILSGLLVCTLACSTQKDAARGPSSRPNVGDDGPSSSTTATPWTGNTACAAASSFWPFGARGAVSLTYDDAMTSPVRHALPALDPHGFKVTFFLTTGKNWDPAFWKPLVDSGHELASHTVTHKANVTRADMEQEIIASLASIKALGVVQPRFSFAYPNGQPNGIDGPYAAVVVKHALAARGLNGGSQKLGAPIDYGNLPARILAEDDDLQAILDDTLAQRSWTTFVVHGIEDDRYLNISKAKHDQLIALLVRKGKDVWVAPFITVADYLQRCAN